MVSEVPFAPIVYIFKESPGQHLSYAGVSGSSVAFKCAVRLYL